jgi:hypothetical protein
VLPILALSRFFVLINFNDLIDINLINNLFDIINVINRLQMINLRPMHCFKTTLFLGSFVILLISIAFNTAEEGVLEVLTLVADNKESSTKIN